VMLSAVMDLLNECLAVSEESLGTFAWLPIAVGGLFACAVLVGMDHALAGADMGVSLDATPPTHSPLGAPDTTSASSAQQGCECGAASAQSSQDAATRAAVAAHGDIELVGRSHGGHAADPYASQGHAHAVVASAEDHRKAWLMFFALAVQHIPEALAMGVAFADADASKEWGTAISVSLAIGLQDIPEVRAVLRGVPCFFFFLSCAPCVVLPCG